MADLNWRIIAITAFPSATVLEMWFGLKSTTEIEINSVLPYRDKPARVTDR